MNTNHGIDINTITKAQAKAEVKRRKLDNTDPAYQVRGTAWKLSKAELATVLARKGRAKVTSESETAAILSDSDLVRILEEEEATHKAIVAKDIAAKAHEWGVWVAKGNGGKGYVRAVINERKRLSAVAV